MKNRILYITIIIASFLASSCKDDYDPNTSLIPSLTAHYLRPSETEFSNYSSSAFNKTFKVESFETSWAFTNTPSWVSLNPKSGNKSESISLSASENLSADSARTAIFYLSSTESDWEYSCAMSVSQGTADATLSVDKSTLNFGGGTETQTITISSNCKWSVSNTTSWISAECDNNKDILTVSVSPNPGKSYRNGSFYIKYGSKSLSVSVKQAPSEVVASEMSLQYDNIASAYTVSIESEADWSATCSDSWIKVSPSSGKEGKSEVSIEVTPNTNISGRTGFVTFYTDNNSKLQIEILQRGLYIEADEELSFSASGETHQLNIRSNTDWQVISSPNWLSLSATEGNGNSAVSVVATENPNSTSRNGEIVLGQQGLDIRFVVNVSQGRKYLLPTSSMLNFSDKAGSSSFTIRSNADWSASYTDNWFTASPLNGRGDCDVKVTVSENNSAIERIGTILYSYADNSANVNIHQLAKYLTIDNKVFDFPSTGGTHTIEICTNAKWTAEVEHNVSWLKLSALSGEGDTNLVITAEDNPSVNVRSTAVIIKSDYLQDIRILVSQQPRTLTLSTQKVLFFADGGASEVISVNTDGKYSITSDAGWFTINQSENNTFTVYAAKNNNNDYREGVVTVALTDLVDCTLSIDLTVVQAGQSGSFILGGFEEDKDWNYASSGELSITVSGYKSEVDWGAVSGGNLVVNITGYTTEYDWNLNDYSNGRATIVHFGNDENWNNSDSTSGKIDKDGHGADSNWDNSDNASGEITGNRYGNDKNWDNEYIN